MVSRFHRQNRSPARDVDRVVLVKRHRGETTDGIEITVACDVSNPLFGPAGAAAIFGPQKGATPAQVAHLDSALQQLAEQMGMTDLADRPGAGAAGGLGFGMLAFFGAQLQPGVEIVASAVQLRDRLRGVDLCITGEGRLDGQSASGKTVVGVARACHEVGVPCIVLAGSIDEGADAILAEGVTAYFGICDRPMSLDTALHEAPDLLRIASSNILRLFGAVRMRG